MSMMPFSILELLILAALGLCALAAAFAIALAASRARVIGGLALLGVVVAGIALVCDAGYLAITLGVTVGGAATYVLAVVGPHAWNFEEVAGRTLRVKALAPAAGLVVLAALVLPAVEGAAGRFRPVDVGGLPPARALGAPEPGSAGEIGIALLSASPIHLDIAIVLLVVAILGSIALVRANPHEE